MAYLTPDELRAILNPDGGDTDLGSAAGMSDTQLAAAIRDAQAKVDGRLARVTTVPLVVPLPELVARIVRDIAAWYATLTYRRGDPLAPTDPVQLRYNEAKADLDGLATGVIPLPGDLDPTVVPASEAVVVNGYDGDLLTPRDAGMSRLGGQWVAGGPRWEGWGF